MPEPPPLGLVSRNTPAVNDGIILLSELCTKKALQYQWLKLGVEFLQTV